MKKALILLVVAILGGLAVFGFMSNRQTEPLIFKISRPLPSSTPVPPTPIPLPEAKILPSTYQVFQSFNNCGPAALSMTLYFYGITKSQAELGQALRPFQNQAGDNDDKSVTLYELGEHAREYGFIPFYRPAGSIETIKKSIAMGFPVVTRTWLQANEDIGHFRVVKGYDDRTETLLQDDSLQGHDLTYSYSDFNDIWKKFNYEYLILVPQDQEAVAQTILGEDIDSNLAWQKAVDMSSDELSANPNDIYARFNLSVAYYHLGDYQKSVSEFENVEAQLPARTLWYQIEPIEAYAKLGNDAKVFAITDRILNNHNRAFSELYLLRGELYKKQGNTEAARQEFERAVFYNSNMKAAREALQSL